MAHGPLAIYWHVICMADSGTYMSTVNFLNIWTPKIFVVITLKFELHVCGSTIEI